MANALALVTPVYGRVELTRIVFEQRARLLVELAGQGILAHQVVVGNDANLTRAREHGFHVLERPNVLGLRINDGFEFAFRELCASHVVYAGSDSWLLADALADLPAQGRARSSAWLSFMNGDELAIVERSPAQGCPPWTWSRELLAPFGFRLVPDERRRILDQAMLDALNTVIHQDDAFDFHREDDPLRAVDFRGPWAEQMTPWEEFVWAAREWRSDPFDALAARFPVDLVEKLERLYS